MDKKIKKKWLKALRSGKYKQGMGTLRIEDRFCCLGVLCDLLDPKKWEQDEYDELRFRYLGERGLLPTGIKVELNINPIDELKVIDMNDTGLHFNRIADWIEENL